MTTHASRPRVGRMFAAHLLTLTAAVLCAATAAIAQSVQPAVFVCHNIVTNPQFNNYPGVATFTVNPDGTVNFVGKYFTNDNPQALSISPNGRFLAVSHASASTGTEDLLIFRINADASLTMWAVYPTPDSPLDTEWINNDTIAALETSSSGTNRVHAYRFVESNPIHSRLTLIDSEVIGSFSAYLQRHPSGNYLYASDAPLTGGGQKIRAFSVNPDGTLDFISDVFLNSYALDMSISPDGARLYSAGGIGSLSGGDSHRVHGFNVDSETGILVPMDGTPFFSPGSSPAHVAFTGDGNILLVGHGGDGDIYSFFISPEDGFLTQTFHSISIGGQGDIGAITTSGDMLFATRRYSTSGSPSGLVVFRINSDGSFFQIGGTISTEGPASDAIAAWQPPPNSRGDINGDGTVDDLDLEAFVAVLLDMPLDESHVARSDLNFDNVADGRDIAPFVSFYLNPIVIGACCRADATCNVIPELDCMLGGGIPNWLGPGTVCSECPTPGPVIIDGNPNVTLFCIFEGSQVFFSITGLNFSPLANAKLVQEGVPDLLPFFMDVQSSDFILAGFDLGIAEPGIYSLIVTNPDNQSATGPDQYLIEFCN